MKNTQKGFIVPIVIVVVVIIIGGGIYFYLNKTETSKNDTPAPVQSTENAAPIKTSQVNSNVDTKSNPSPVIPKPIETTPAQPKAVVPTPNVVKKNAYTNTAAGYSLELPENWVTNLASENSDPKKPQNTQIYLSIKGEPNDNPSFTFDVQTGSTQDRIDYYKQEFSKTPTNDDLFNSFIETQKSVEDEFVMQSSKKVMINGKEAYSASATFAGGAAVLKYYVFYTSKNTYVIRISSLADTWPKWESQILGVVGTFKIQ